MAAGLVPELSAFGQYGTLYFLAKERNMTEAEVLRLPYDDAMRTFAYKHHQQRYMDTVKRMQDDKQTRI